eukprot:scaffold6282_cov119-Isochrysis_galbana.AAC.11
MKLTIAWGAPSAGVAKRMRMAWCLRAAGTLAQAVVVHAAPTPSPANSGLKKEKGMGKEWGRGGGVTGRQKDRGCPAVTPLVCSAFF